jgi:hypothetical protein
VSVLSYLASEPPAGATGHVRRLVGGVITDEVEFAYLAPEQWRVRHASGREILSVAADVWERPHAGAPWRHDRAEHASAVHHTGYLRGMLFPRLLTSLTDPGSRIAENALAATGSRRLRVDHVEPVNGSMTIDVTPAGRLRRIAGSEDGRVVEIELSADFDRPPPAHVFDPTTRWPPGDRP